MSLVAFQAWGQVAPALGTAAGFAVLGGSTVTSTGPSLVTGSLGVSPGSTVTGFPPGLASGGTTHAADAVALGAQSDTTAAFINLAGQPCNATYWAPAELGGLTLMPGVYCFSSSAQLTGTLTLNGGGDPDAVWLFKTASSLITASNSRVVLIDGAQSCNVFWQVGSSAALGTGTTFVGNILALTSITLATKATLAGRALARNGAVTLDSNAVALATCGVLPGTAVPPTLGKAFSPNTIAPGGASTLTLTLTNPGTLAAALTSPLLDTLPSGLSVMGGVSTTCGGAVTTSSSTVALTGGSIPGGGSCTVTARVSSKGVGAYFNSIPAGALQTDQGSNAAPAGAILFVLVPVISSP